MPRAFVYPVTFLLGLLILGWGRSATADLITQTVSTPLNVSTDFSIPLTIKTFDKSLGTLQDVVITYTDQETMKGTLTNNAKQKENYKVTEASTFTLALGVNKLLTNNMSAAESYTGVKVHQTVNFGAFHAVGGAGPLKLTNGAIFDSFLANTAFIHMNFSSLTSLTVAGGGGNGETAIYSNAEASMTVEYFYEPVLVGHNNSIPEPSSLRLSVVGAVTIGVIGFCRKQRRRPGVSLR